MAERAAPRAGPPDGEGLPRSLSAAYMAARGVSWRELPGGKIEFTMKRLRSADQKHEARLYRRAPNDSSIFNGFSRQLGDKGRLEILTPAPAGSYWRLGEAITIPQ